MKKEHFKVRDNIFKKVLKRYKNKEGEEVADYLEILVDDKPNKIVFSVTYLVGWSTKFSIESSMSTAKELPEGMKYISKKEFDNVFRKAIRYLNETNGGSHE